MDLSPEMATIAMAAYGTATPKANIEPPKLYICALPKSGLHLATRFAVTLLRPWHAIKNWYGTNAWTNDENIKNLELAAAVLGNVKRGQYTKGHLAYVKAMEWLFQILGFGFMFVYRDLRDVVVSQAYHIMSDDTVKFKFDPQGRSKYAGMSKEEIMLATINGDDVVDPLIERWERYAGWLDCDWILQMRFEEMVLRRERAAGTFFDYIHKMALKDSGATGTMTNERTRKAIIKCIVVESKQTSPSPTYRKGKVGSWKHEFTPAVTAAFKERDVNNWLIELGYAKNKDW